MGLRGPQCGLQEPSCKNLAGLLSPRPRFLSSRKERNQRFAKEEVSSLDSPPRGTSPRELRKAKFSPPDFPITRWLLGFASVTPRVVGTYVERTRYRYRGVSKGVMLDPFRWRSRNQEVPCAPFVHFLAIGNGPRGAGAGSHPANRLCRKFGEGNFVSFSCRDSTKKSTGACKMHRFHIE